MAADGRKRKGPACGCTTKVLVAVICIGVTWVFVQVQYLGQTHANGAPIATSAAKDVGRAAPSTPQGLRGGAEGSGAASAEEVEEDSEPPHSLEAAAQAAAQEVHHEAAKVAFGDCVHRPSRPQHWGKVVPEDIKIIRDRSTAIKSCKRHGKAMVFEVDLEHATVRKDKNAYDLDFPDYVVADERGAGYRSTRSNLQLFVHLQGKSPRPMGPAHADHSLIAAKGDGAFSHWRDLVTSGDMDGRSRLRFSLPGNVPLKQVLHLTALVFPMAPPMGYIEWIHKPDKKAKDYDPSKRRRRKELFRELYFETFPTTGVEPHLVDKPDQVKKDTWYLWRGSHHDEFDVPLKDGELYEKRMPYQFVDFFGAFEQRGGKLFPPPSTYKYYENKVALSRLFQQAGVKTPPTWIFQNREEAMASASQIQFPVVVKDPYGYSSIGLLQAHSQEEFGDVMTQFFANAKPTVEALVQSKVVALREARITYVDGQPFHGYWRIRESLKSASAASTRGGFQDFNFPLARIAPVVERFANITGVPVGGVDFIWSDANPDVSVEPYCLEVSPTSDINPPSPSSWTLSYALFKKTKGFRNAYLKVRRQWTDHMVLSVIDRYRRRKRTLFVDIDNVVSLSAARVKRWKGDKKAYTAPEVMRDEVVPDAKAALQELRDKFIIRFLTARGQYEDAFNVTRTWLDAKGFGYDDLLVVRNPADKVAHMSPESILIDDFTNGHDKDEPVPNDKFKAELTAAKLPFVVFPFGGRWADVLPRLREEASKWPPR